MKIELTKTEYELLQLFRQLTTEEKLTVLSAGSALPSARPASASPALTTV